MSGITPSDRAQAVPFQGIRRVMEQIARLEQQGRSVVNLCIGRPDFDTPNHIKRAAVRALEQGHVHYTANAGVLPLRQAIADKLRRENGFEVEADGGVIVTIGGTQALFISLMSYLNPGDECLIPSPGWLSYYQMAKLAGATPVPAPMIEDERGFTLDLDAVESALSPRTRAIIITDPHNPTGGVLSRSHKLGLVELARRHNILLLTDEVYDRQVYDDHQHESIAALPGAADVTLVVNGLSKSYSMTGWRIGYVAGAVELLAPILKLHQYTVVCATSFAQYGAIEALTASQEQVEAMRLEFDRRRRLMVAGLNNISGISCSNPLGAFYVFPCFREWGLDPDSLTDHLLERCGVGAVGGGSFGAEGHGYMRLSYATSYDQLELALERLAAGARELGL